MSSAKPLCTVQSNVNHNALLNGGMGKRLLIKSYALWRCCIILLPGACYIESTEPSAPAKTCPSCIQNGSGVPP